MTLSPQAPSILAPSSQAKAPEAGTAVVPARLMTKPREGPSVAEKAAASSCFLPNAQLLDQIRGEYLEMPGLKLTLAQAQRLWQLGEECLELLGMLVDAKFLCRKSDGRYARVSELDVSIRRPSMMKAGIDSPAVAVLLFCECGSDRVDIKLWNVRRAQIHCLTCGHEAWLDGFTVSEFDPRAPRTRREAAR